MENNILIKSKNSIKDLRSVSLYVYFHSLTGILFTVLGTFMLFNILIYFTGIYPNNKFPLAESLFSIFSLIIIPSLHIIKANKNMKNGVFSEAFEYHLNDKSITIKGESFSSTIDWKNIYKVNETKKWFLFYLNKTNVYFITKSILDDNTKAKFIGLISSIPNLKAKLKE